MVLLSYRAKHNPDLAIGTMLGALQLHGFTSRTSACMWSHAFAAASAAAAPCLSIAPANTFDAFNSFTWSPASHWSAMRKQRTPNKKHWCGLE